MQINYLSRFWKVEVAWVFGPLCTQKYRASGGMCLIISHLQSLVARQTGVVKPRVLRLMVCHLGPERGSSWVYTTYGPGSATGPACEGSEKAPLNLHLLSSP